ncbi:unnamed protein product, partial [marine sediment metagenome]
MRFRSTFNWTCGVLAVGLVMVVSAGGVHGQAPQEAQTREYPTPLEDQWVLAYANDFSQPDNCTDWVIVSGSGVVAEGVLALKAVEGLATATLTGTCFSSPGVRIEFDAYIAGSPGIGG